MDWWPIPRRQFTQILTHSGPAASSHVVAGHGISEDGNAWHKPRTASKLDRNRTNSIQTEPSEVSTSTSSASTHAWRILSTSGIRTQPCFMGEPAGVSCRGPCKKVVDRGKQSAAMLYFAGLLRGFAPTASPARSLWAKAAKLACSYVRLTKTDGIQLEIWMSTWFNVWSLTKELAVCGKNRREADVTGHISSSLFSTGDISNLPLTQNPVNLGFLDTVFWDVSLETNTFNEHGLIIHTFGYDHVNMLGIFGNIMFKSTHQHEKSNSGPRPPTLSW